MKSKKNIIISIILILFIIGIIALITVNAQNKSVKKEEINNEATEQLVEQETIDFLNAIAGVKAENIEIINTPVIGFKGDIFIPEDTILNGINYFLKNNNNDKMNNLKVDIENNSIDLYVDYAVTDKISTPIKVNISPTLNKNGDLAINIGEIKILDLKLADFLVNLALKTFVKDWFIDSNIKIEYEKSKIIISKDNFNGINIDSLLVDNDGISLNVIIDTEKIMK